MKKVTDIARETIAWLMLIAACYLAGPVLRLLFGSDPDNDVPGNHTHEWDSLVIPIICTVVVTLGYMATHTLLSVGRSIFVVAVVVILLSAASWRIASGA